MRNLKILLKLHSFELDTLIKDLNQAELRQNELINTLKIINDNIQKETDMYLGSNFNFVLESYLKLEKQKATLCAKKIEILDKTINDIKESILLNFAETKKIEILINKKEITLQEKEKQDELSIQDEAASNRLLYVN
jgi:hypothetical protein